MVLPGEGDYMATGHERSKTRHNFTLPNLKWGIQRNLSCMKVESDGGSSGSGDQRLRRRSSPFKFGGGVENLSCMKVESDADLRRTMTKEKEELEPRGKEREVPPPGVAVEVRPWNLRKRRAACKSPIPETGNCDAKILEEKEVNLGNKSANSTRPKLVSTLLKKEIEDDYMTLIGHRPPRRPKKRPRTVQKQVDLLYPAFYFAEITPDIYKVSDAAENGKR